MTVPTTTAFNLPLDDIIDRAFTRAFGEKQTGYDLRSANAMLGLLFQEFQVRGDPLWAIAEAHFTIAAVDGGVYTLPSNVVDIRDMWTRDLTITPAGNDLAVARIPRATYELIPNKLDAGRSYQFYEDRQRDAPVIKLYPVVNVDATYALYYSYVRRLYDIGSDYTANADAPVRWLPTIIAGLAWYIAMDNRKKLGLEWVDKLKTEFEGQYVLAANEDSDASPTRIEVDVSAYFGR